MSRAFAKVRFTKKGIFNALVPDTYQTQARTIRFAEFAAAGVRERYLSIRPTLALKRFTECPTVKAE